MDLSSLLNTQVKEEPSTISLQDIQHLLSSNANRSIIVDKLRTNVIFSYPPQRTDSFVFFDTFIQLLLSINLNDEYTKSIVIDAFRNCMNGLLHQHGNSWLVEFPMHLTRRTWTALRDQPDVTLLVYLYGLVLTFTNTPDWIEAMVQFRHSNYLGIIIHLWLTCCCTLDENEFIDSDLAKAKFLDQLESGLAQDKTDTETNLTKEMIHVLKNKDTQYLMTHVNKYLGGALAKPMFTEDDFHIGYFSMQTACQACPFRYTLVSKVLQDYLKESTQSIESFATSKSDNPLLNEELLETWTADKYAQAQSIRNGTLFWIRQMSTMLPATFDMYLKKAIIQHYPTDRKTVLDLLLADWTMRDRFHRHLDFMSDILLKTICEKSYNKRTAPYYAFVQLFNIPDEHHQQQKDSNTTDTTGVTAADASYYETKSGAYIDLSQFSNCSDFVLMQGCCRFLEKMTLQDANVHVKEWVGDCLQIASSNIVQHYIGFLANGLNQELSVEKNKATLRFAPYLQVALKACVSLSAYALPTLLQSFHLQSLEWLLKTNAKTAAAMMAHYFDDGPQVSKYVVVQSLFVTKPKQYMDLLLAYLRDLMSGTDPKLPKSRAWFKNHFLGVILSLVGEDATGQGVACRIFRQLFKTRDNFEWYFATSLVPTEKTINFKPLDLSNSHNIYAIKNSGLAAMLQEMIRLGDTAKKERLIQVWFDLWTTKNGSKFTVPVSWVLQSAGLYDQAPVIVKQMIKRFVNIGLSLQQQEGEQDIMRMAPERKFLDRIMDLVLLSDTPEPDNLFELILNVSTADDKQRYLFQEINWAIINILVELSEELEMELLLLASQPQQQQPPSQPVQLPQPPLQTRYKKKMSRRMIKKIDKMTQRKLRNAMRKHEEELEKYLLQQSQTNNAIKALTTLVQRVFGFLLRLLNNTMIAVDSTTNTSLSIKQDIQHELIHIPLFYEPLAKLVRLIREPEDLHEDIQSTADLCLEYLKKQPDTTLYETCQKIFSGL